MIYALCEEGDAKTREVCRDNHIFLSTPSARRATQSKEIRAQELAISIHALREEGD